MKRANGITSSYKLHTTRHCRPRGYFQLQYRPSQCTTVKPVMSSLCWPVCLTEGPLLHVPWGSLSAAVLKRALSSRLTRFPPCSEGLTVLLGVNEEEFALPWQKISHNPWQLWQLVMAACWWELCNPPLHHLRHRLHCHHQPSAPPLQSFMWSTPRMSSFFFIMRTTKWKYRIQVPLSCERNERTGSTKAKQRAAWVTGRSWKAHKAI